MSIGEFFFKYRSYTPIPFALLIIYQSETTPGYFLSGLIVALAGEFIRFVSVRAAGGATRTRKVGAKRLCTWGPYAHVRNPLYLANLLIYLGVIIAAQGEWILWLGSAAIIFLILQYTSIVFLEEKTLSNLFGSDYENYKRMVPRIIPRIKPQIQNKNPEYESLGRTFYNERRTLQNIGLIFALIVLKNLLL